MSEICPDNWGEILDDPTPMAVRWAKKEDRFRNLYWTKWHYSEGNFYKTACGEYIISFIVDGSPQETDIEKVDCKKCLSKMKQYKNATTPD